MRLIIPLSDASSDVLRELASREFRDPRMQAKLLLERALGRADTPASDGRVHSTGSRELEALAR